MQNRNIFLLPFVVFLLLTALSSCGKKMVIPLTAHPEVDQWEDLFAPDLSNTIYPEGVWTFENGILTASEDQNIWPQKVYDNFILDLEFQVAPGTNSGVIVYCSNIDDWIPNSVEVQIADDSAEQWANSPKTWQCAAIFGRLAASESRVKKPGEWNRMTITCQDKMIYVFTSGI